MPGPRRGLGIDDPERRDSIGEDRITFFRARRLGIMGRMMLTEIDHVAIAVQDLDAAVDYYQQAFGATSTTARWSRRTSRRCSSRSPSYIHC